MKTVVFCSYLDNIICFESLQQEVINLNVPGNFPQKSFCFGKVLQNLKKNSKRLLHGTLSC
jgi:hypothetical protein